MMGTPPDKLEDRSSEIALTALELDGWRPLLDVLGATIHQANISVVITDAAQNIVYVNPAFTQQTGYSAHEVLGRNPRFLQGPDTNPLDRQRLREHLTRGEHVHQLILNYRKDGQPLWLNMHISPLYQDGVLRYYAALQENASDRIEQQEQMEWDIAHDVLTGLRNRYGLREALDAHVQTAQPFALLLFDLDNFKQINDTFGHAEGDQLLQRMAGFLTAHTRAEDQVFRWGGDEFLVILPGADRSQAQTFAERIHLDLISHGGLGLGASVGMAFHPEDEQVVAALILRADERMYQQKLSRRKAMPLN